MPASLRLLQRQPRECDALSFQGTSLVGYQCYIRSYIQWQCTSFPMKPPLVCAGGTWFARAKICNTGMAMLMRVWMRGIQNRNNQRDAARSTRAAIRRKTTYSFSIRSYFWAVQLPGVTYRVVSASQRVGHVPRTGFQHHVSFRNPWSVAGARPFIVPMFATWGSGAWQLEVAGESNPLA